MEEIAPNIFLEDGFPGVVLSAFRFKNHLLLVDSPFRSEDIRIWRSKLAELGSNIEKTLVILDAHIDRTIGTRAMEAIIVGHENAVEIIRSRPTSGRGQDLISGAECDMYDLPSSIRWTLPSMTFTKSLSIYLDENHIELSHRPGAHLAGSWLLYEAEKLLFVGDSVMANQPPFLAWSDLGLWLEELEELLSDKYKGYKIITSRNGVVRTRTIEKWLNYLTRIKDAVDAVASADGQVSDLLAVVPDLLKRMNFVRNLTELYENRLNWGLEEYYKRRFLSIDQSQELEE
jgi:glyoxylase-like metal-dependent hydrolase (beta-lactamase superfamily II)